MALTPDACELSIVVPIYNEAEILVASIRAMLVGVEELGKSFELVLSENGSRDGTRALVDQLAREDPRIRPLHFPAPDYGHALRKGLLACRGDALSHFSMDIVDFDFLAASLEFLDEADIVIGSKLMGPSLDQRGWGRRTGAVGYHKLTQLILGMPVKDTHINKTFRRDRVRPILEQCKFGGGIFDDELVIRAHRAGLRLKEIPLAIREIRPSRKKVFGQAIRAARDLIKLRMTLG